jgi:hypothetical protein
MSDIVERLRKLVLQSRWDAALCIEAANEIERLRNLLHEIETLAIQAVAPDTID